MPNKLLQSNKKLLQRYGHSAASFTISPQYMEVVLFGGQNKSYLNIADTAVLRFGKCPNIADTAVLRFGKCPNIADTAVLRFGKVLCHTTHLIMK